MLKSETHYEQIQLDAVKKIMEGNPVPETTLDRAQEPTKQNVKVDSLAAGALDAGGSKS